MPIGGPSITPLQAAAGVTVKLVNTPLNWSTRGVDRVLEAVRRARPALNELRNRGVHAGEVAAKTLSASRDAALATAEKVTRDEGVDRAADALQSVRSAAGVLDPAELPIADFDELNVSDAVAAVKDLTAPADIRAILAYEEAHKNRQRVVSGAQTRIADIAKGIVGIN